MSNYQSLAVGDRVRFKNKLRSPLEPNYYQYHDKIFEVVQHFEDRDDGKVYEHYVNLKCISDPKIVIDNPVYDTELKVA